MAEQFTRFRDGDRFFYLNQHFTPGELNILRQGDTLARVIEANTGVTNLQGSVFLFRASIGGPVSLGGGGGAAGMTVQLQDTGGDVLATTVTDAQGRYSFNQLSGPSANPDIASGVSATGYYNVLLALPSGVTQTSANPAPVLISRGDVNVSGVDFTIAPATSTAAQAATAPAAGPALDPAAVDGVFAGLGELQGGSGGLEHCGAPASPCRRVSLPGRPSGSSDRTTLRGG